MTQRNKTDVEVKAHVLEELKFDTRVDETEVGVEVRSGGVTLSGEVDSYSKKRAAEAAAHHVAGVLDVANDITVRTPFTRGKSDTDIASMVRRALEWSVLVPDKWIRSTVDNGLVTLEGHVNTLAQRDDAEDAVAALEGVGGVINDISVEKQADPVEVQRTIRDALARQMMRESKRIEVTVKDGTAVLSGTVRSWAEKRAALGAAKGTPGVSRVSDHLRIDWAA